eukprot:TRINITY_DN7587_c0_g1_i2.p1 TRINITY_DN7587_c0_g1~~TRINITY_DN7587_c0_g1_i2.p1  ORF type:complete len:535 (-),score=75.80 TRINITY_DN7587_c0_g1_i2:437-2011(-)
MDDERQYFKKRKITNKIDPTQRRQNRWERSKREAFMDDERQYFKKRKITNKIDPTQRRQNRWERSKRMQDVKRQESLSKNRNLHRGFRQLEQNIYLLLENLTSKEVNLQLEAAIEFRKILSKETKIDAPFLRDLVNLGVIPQFVSFLADHRDPLLQFESSWVLTNIVAYSSENIDTIVNAGALPRFIRLLGSPSNVVREQAAWALGNLSGESAKHRDMVLASGALPSLIELCNVDQQGPITMIRYATWAISNLCRGRPQPNFESVKLALPTLAQLLQHTDEQVLIDACWALTYLSDGPTYRIEAVVNTNIGGRLVSLLKEDVATIITPALRVVGNIVSGDDACTERMIEHDVLTVLLNLTKHARINIRREACWAISNIAAGPVRHIQLIVNSGIIPRLFQIMNEPHTEVSKEALFAIVNILINGYRDHLDLLVDAGVVTLLLDTIMLPYVNDPRRVVLALEGIESLINAPEGNHIKHFAEADAIARIIECQHHPWPDIARRATTLHLHLIAHLPEAFKDQTSKT